MNRLLETLLELTSLSHEELSIESINLRNVVKETTIHTRERYPEKQINLVKDSAEIEIHGHRGSLERILTNLIENACKHGTDGTPIDIELTDR